MPLPTLNWKRLAPVTLAANNVNAMLDALYAAGTAATYADGSARVPGTGSAWSWAIDTTNALQPGATTAAYATAPTVTAVNQRIIWAGSTNAPTNMPVYLTDTRLAAVPFCSVVKGGTYADWNAATPFTGGQCLGFARAAVAPATAVWTTMNMWESQEAVAVQWSRAAPNVNTSINVCGAFADPGATANGESDGRLYGIATTGWNNYCLANFWVATGDSLFTDSNVANQGRCGFFVPGTGNAERYLRLANITVASTFLSRGGEVPLIPVYLVNAASQYPAVLRQIDLTRDTLSNLTLQNAGVPKGYTLGANIRTTDADACVLTL